MALFRRIRSPRELKTTTPATNIDQETDDRGRDSIVSLSDPAGIDLLGSTESPPDLPPRNNSIGGGNSPSYRRTQSSGAMSSSVKLPGHQPRPQQADYFAPSDLVLPITVPPTVKEQRNQNMHDKIMTLNTVAKTKSHSHEKLTDMSDYSVPFNVLQQEREKLERGERGGSVSLSKPNRRHHPRTQSHGEDALRSSVPPVIRPPDYRPPPPPKDSTNSQEPPEQNFIEDQQEPSVSPNPPEDNYECPWDSKKFQMLGRGGKQRSKSDLDPGNSPPAIPDPYRSPNLPHHPFAATSTQREPSPDPEAPQLPPRTGVGHYETAVSSMTHQHQRDRATSEFEREPPSPPIPDTARPRAITGEPNYCIPPDAEMHALAYVNQPPLHEKLPSVPENKASYVNQPPPLPPRGYKELLPTNNSLSHSPDLRNPPACIIDTRMPLEEQPWYHGKITRDQAEEILRNQPDFSFLVRNSESSKMDFSLSLRDRSSPAAHGFVHLKIQNKQNGYILGQFSSPFRTVTDCIDFYTKTQLTIRDITHRRLGFPVGRIERFK